MTMDKALAKSLLDRDEKSLFDVAAGARLNKLTLVELQDYVGRSRQTRDKWSDLVKKQRRASQKKAGQRQTTENARSEQKSQLLQEVHQAFVERLAAVQAGGAEVPAGTKATPIPRKTRKVINRVDRAVTRNEVAKVQETLVVQQRQARKVATRDRAATKAATGTAVAKTAKGTVKKSAKASVAAKSKAAAKPTRPSKVVAAATAAKKSRTKAAAKLAGASGKPVMPAISSKAPVRQPASQGLSKAQIAANQKLHAKATKARVAAGGTTKIKSHVAAANRRQQSRRDGR